MSENTEKKSRFEISREVQEEFVNGIAESMLKLAEKAGKWQEGWATAQPLGMPYCPATGKEYNGANSVRLLMASMLSGYDDNRWMTFKQIQELQSKNPDLELRVRKGEHGIKILRPEEVFFTVDEEGHWNFLNAAEIKQIRQAEADGEEHPEVKRKTLFYPFTVFNAKQIDGFPARETPVSPMTEIERNEFVERFVASSGVEVQHYNGGPCFSHSENTVKLPHPDTFYSTEEYYAAKLHEFFHATGHETRENRQQKTTQTLKGYVFEEMRAEMFSMLAGATLKLPMPESNSAAYIDAWNQKFSGGDARAIFKAASEASKMIAVMCQFGRDEQPSPKWFPPKGDWPELVEMQRQRDIANGVAVKVSEISETPVFMPRERRPGPKVKIPEIVADFKNAHGGIEEQARIVLNSPEFLEMALKQDPKQMREMASLFDHLAFVLSHEADQKLTSAPKTVDASVPLTEQRIAAQTRMRV